MPFCTYITIYSGNLLPPFYIGSTSISKIQDGYRGSVSSKKYRYIWKDELKRHPHLFITKIISTHSNRKEALDKEIFLHEHFRVHKNELYVNQATASGKFGIMGKRSEEYCQKLSDIRKGKKKSNEHRQKISLAMKGRHLSNTHKQKISDANRKRKHSLETRLKMSNAHKKKNL